MATHPSKGAGGFGRRPGRNRAHMMADRIQMSNILHKRGERPDVLVHVADNVRRLRRAAGLSQAALAERAAVSRRMLVAIEKGDDNVSLNTLDRIAEALGVFFYVLVQPPDNADSARIDEIAWVGQSPDSQARLLASKAARNEVELWAWSLAPGERYDSPPDNAGWLEMLVVTHGRLTLLIGERRHVIEAGDFHAFASDCDHSYLNEGDAPLRFIRNTVY